MAATKYYARFDGQSVTIDIPVKNITTAVSGPVSVVFSAFSNFTLTSTTKNVGVYHTGSRTWDTFKLAPGETQTIHLIGTVTDIDTLSTPVNITGTITNAVDGNDGAGTSISVTIVKEEDVNVSQVYKAIVAQSGKGAPSATVLQNEFSDTIVWARSSEGVYTATLTGAFLSGVTMFWYTPVGNPTAKKFSLVRTDNNVLTLSTFASDGTTPDDLDGSLNLIIEEFPD